jgi:uncharacterized membrane protein
MSRWLWVSIGLTVLAFAGSLYVYNGLYDRLPERVPIHWDLHGEPNGYTNKSNVWMTFLLLPGTMALFVVLTVVLPWVSPKRFEVENFRAVWDYLMMLAVALFGYIHFVTLLGSFEGRLPMFRLLLGGLCLFFILLGNVLGQVRRNFWMGVRTPWTLASDAVWIQTHRLAAWLFVAAGVLGLIAVILDLSPVVVFVVVILAAFVPAVYSLVLYKQLERAGKL